jgi:hypothetical protein
MGSHAAGGMDVGLLRVLCFGLVSHTADISQLSPSVRLPSMLCFGLVSHTADISQLSPSVRLPNMLCQFVSEILNFLYI